MEAVRVKTCDSCNSTFNCTDNCWCNDFPVIMPLNPLRNCICYHCLKKEVVEKIDEYMNPLTLENREKIKALGNVNKPIEGIDYYINEDNLFVFTAWYHLRRGFCCENNCLNCPYKNKKT